MSEPEKADLGEFVRQVLYHLSALGAEAKALRAMQAETIAHLKGIPVQQVQDHYREFVSAETDRLYRDSCDAAKIPPPDDPG